MNTINKSVDPHSVECWIFDLDNTLYPAATNLFQRVSSRMTLFIADEYGLEPDEARAFQRQMFRSHGTTLRGLMVERDLDPDRFLDFVHDIDLDDIEEDPELDRLIGQLAGRKLVFTNGSRGHADRILGRLGLARHFEAVFDIADSDYVPKPAPGPYRNLIERHGVEPTRAVMIEDMARNLIPAAEMGMTTVWLRHDRDWARESSEGDHVHHVADDLASWLSDLLEIRG